MAMSGCFVPAEYASFRYVRRCLCLQYELMNAATRIHDALLTRLSNDDDIEKSLSTFANEMASSAMILGLTTSHSLVLVDELGRGTSPTEGVGISHAIAEEMIDTGVSESVLVLYHNPIPFHITAPVMPGGDYAGWALLLDKPTNQILPPDELYVYVLASHASPSLEQCKCFVLFLIRVCTTLRYRADSKNDRKWCA